MSKSELPGIWRIIGKPFVFSGFAFGSCYSSVIITLDGQILSQRRRSEILHYLKSVVPIRKNVIEDLLVKASKKDWFSSVEWVVDVIYLLQSSADMAIFEKGRILNLKPGQAVCQVPINLNSVKPLVQVLAVLFQVISSRTADSGLSELQKRLTLATTLLQKFSPGGANVPHFLRAAFELGIPFQPLQGGVFSYGQGRRTRWMDSSFTDETPQIAAKMARNKVLAAAMLRQAGLPVADHKVVTTAEEAVKVAGLLGYPVVVKPADLDGGVGVAARLLSAETVEAAFHKCKAHSSNILVEKHVEGKDFRVVVYHDEVIGAFERVPGGVTGDAVHTVEELVIQLNSDPRRGEGKHNFLKLLHLDNEALEFLQEVGLSLSSIPAIGRFVRLRGAANISSGGVPVEVLDRVHPDNRRLAIRAAKALRLDLAGVDILIPDVSCSWRESGAFICEVNGQPNLRSLVHLYVPVLCKQIPGDGRVPTVVVFGAPEERDSVHQIELQLLEKGMVAGCHDFRGVRVDGEVVLDGALTPFRAGKILSFDRAVAALILSVNDDSVLKTGLPFARFDLLVLAGMHISGSCVKARAEQEKLLRDLLMFLLPACDGKVVNLEGSGLDVAAPVYQASVNWEAVTVKPDQVVKVVVDEIMEVDKFHSKPGIYD